MKSKKIIGLALALALVGAACASDDEDATATAEGEETTEETEEESSEETEESEEAAEIVTEISLTSNGLEPLENGVHYEGWVLVDGEPYSTGKFNVDAEGNFTTVDGEPFEGAFGSTVDASEASDFVLTVEPDGDTDAVPSDPKLVGGEFADGATTATIDHPGALGTDFSEGTGSFTFATPSDDVEDNDLAGVWFLSLASGEPEGTLDLPELPVGWTYEGWAVIDGVPYSTGQFTDPLAPDNFSGFTGPNDVPPYPGEDFVENLPEALADLEGGVDLSGATIVISVEPVPDDSEAPFVLKPFVGEAPEDAEARVDYDLEADDSSFPTVDAELV